MENENAVEELLIKGENESNKIWNQAKKEIEKRLSPVKYKTWFKNLEVVKSENNTMALMAENEFSKIILETRYNEFIKRSLNFITDEDWTVVLLAKENSDKFNNLWK